MTAVSRVKAIYNLVSVISDDDNSRGIFGLAD